MQNNIAALTRSHNAIAAKKRAKREQVKEVLFDDEARREFLTGFHKRKKAKAEAARNKAKEREKQERLEDRRERRQYLREKALQNAAEVEGAYRGLLGNDDQGEDNEWEGIGQSSLQEKDEEYEGEEIVATVTVVEDFDPTTITTAPPPRQISEEQLASVPSHRPPPLHTTRSEPKTKKKVRAKKIRYETKEARKSERGKQHKRKLEKAALAGGKASRKGKVRR